MAKRKITEAHGPAEFRSRLEKLDDEYNLLKARIEMLQEQLADKEAEINELLAEGPGYYT